MQLTQLSTRQRNRKAIEEVTCSSSSTLEQHFFNTHSTHFRSCWSTSIPGVVPLNISALGHCFLLQRKVFPGMGHNCEYVSSLVSRKAIMMMYFQFSNLFKYLYLYVSNLDTLFGKYLKSICILKVSVSRYFFQKAS